MYIELLDILRCTSDHPQIPLVTAISERDGRFVVDATVGCPACRREYRVVRGVAWFTDELPPETPAPIATPDDEAAVRLAAFLAVSEGATYAITGEWARHAPEIAELVAARIYALNPGHVIEETERLGVIRSDRRLPFAHASLRGLAIGDASLSETELDAALGAVAPGGRLVAPASLPVPAGVSELARDDSVWVGEKRGPLVVLHRR